MQIDPVLGAQVVEMVRGVVGTGTSSISVWTGGALFTLKVGYDLYRASSTRSPRTPRPLPPPIDEYSLPVNPLLGPQVQDQSVVKLRRPPPLNILPPTPLPENPMDPQVQDRLNLTTGGGGGGDGGGGGGGTTVTIPTPDRYSLPTNPLERQPDMSIIKLPPRIKLPPPPPPPSPTPLTPPPVVNPKSPLNMWQQTRLAAGGLAAAGGGSLMASLAALLLARSKEEKKAMKKEKTKAREKTKTTGTKTKTKTDGPCCRQNVRILLEAHE
jgi:hypothetical protein